MKVSFKRIDNNLYCDKNYDVYVDGKKVCQMRGINDRGMRYCLYGNVPKFEHNLQNLWYDTQADVRKLFQNCYKIS